MRTPDGSCSGRLSLDVLEGRLELAVLGGGHAIRTCPVGCLLEAARLLSKHTKSKLRLDKAVHSALRDLKPSRACAQHLLSKLQSSQSKGGTSMCVTVQCRVGECCGGV